MWVDDYVGRPYQPGVFECGDLVALVLRERFGIAQEVPHSLEDYISEAVSSGDWRAVASPDAGDVALMLTAVGHGKTAPLHVGVMVNASHVLHVDIGRASVCLPIRHPVIKARLSGFYRNKKFVL